MAGDPAAQDSSARSGAVPRFRRTSARVDDQRNRVILPKCDAGRPQYFRFYRWLIHVLKRASGSTLWGPLSHRPRFSKSGLDWDWAWRDLDASRRFDSYVVWKPDLGGTAWEVDSREHIELSCSAASS